MSPISDHWQQWRRTVDLDEYEARWDQLAAQGQDVHGEADFVWRYHPASVLDAGCGMGRIGIELARRGANITGVDLDPDLLERARRAAPTLRWINSDLADLELGEVFDVVVLGGNVIPFVDPSDQSRAVARCAAHVRPGGLLIAGFSLRPDWPTAEQYDAWCTEADLEQCEAHPSWDAWRTNEGSPESGEYRVFVHQHRTPATDRPTQ